MGWWEGSDDVRLLISPGTHGTGNGIGQLISLLHPKTGNTTCYLLVNEMLQEIRWFKQPYSSWFLGDYVAEDGRLYTATPVDPVFILLPIFDEARMRKGDDPGNFRQLDEIIFIDGYPGYQHLFSVAEKSMQVVCDVKEIGSSKFFRLDDSKVLSWLYYKVCQIKETLLTLDKNYAAREEKDTLSDAVSIMGEYLKDDPWLKHLCCKLRLDLTEARKKASDVESIPPESELGSFIASQEKNNSNSSKTTTRVGKQTQKAKIETNSRNIKEMFTRASLRRKK